MSKNDRVGEGTLLLQVDAMRFAIFSVVSQLPKIDTCNDSVTTDHPKARGFTRLLLLLRYGLVSDHFAICIIDPMLLLKLCWSLFVTFVQKSVL